MFDSLKIDAVLAVPCPFPYHLGQIPMYAEGNFAAEKKSINAHAFTLADLRGPWALDATGLKSEPQQKTHAVKV